MRRFYLPPGQIASGVITLEEAEARHAADVLRIRPGEEAAILDGEGREYQCRVEKVERKKIDLKVVQTHTSPKPACRITLAQAIPKGKIFESIIQKATELGVFRIVPLLSERVITRLEDESAERKADKWRQTAVEAIKQCGQRWLPKVDPPMSLPAALAKGEPFDLALVGSLQNGAHHPREYFFDYARKNSGQSPASVVAWIGPEGDFSPDEVAAIEKSGARPITLGPLVLRSETAAIYTLSIINYELSSPIAPGIK
jgi:16S rRNA (uracil1498-N3)-methyltransferase